MKLKNAQSIAEYSICLAVIMLAIASMQHYVRRGLQGRYADVVDHTTSQVSTIHQYEPYYINFVEDGGDVNSGVTHIIDENIDYERGGKITKNIIKDKKTVPRRLNIDGINCYDD